MISPSVGSCCLAVLVLVGCTFSANGLTVAEDESGGSSGSSSPGGQEPPAETGGQPTTTGPTSGAPDPAVTTSTGGPGETTGHVSATMQSGDTGGSTDDASTAGEVSSGGSTDTGDVAGGSTAGASSEGGGSNDGGCTPTAWYADMDEDMYGDPATKVEACEAPDGYVDNDLDCGPEAKDVSPAVLEKCDNKDNDCDGLVDEYSAMNSSMCGDCAIVPDDPAAPTRAYYFCKTAKTWSVAKGLCAGKQAALVADKTGAVHALLTGQLAVTEPMTGGWWLGGYATDIIAYKWLDGTTINNNDPNWDYGKLLATISNCVQLLAPDENKGDHWTDRNCGEMKPYICEQAL